MHAKKNSLLKNHLAINQKIKTTNGILHMLYFFIFIVLNTSMLQAMNVNTKSVSKKREREEVSIIALTPPKESSPGITDTFTLTDEQTQLCQWTIKETKAQILAIQQYGELQYPHGTTLYMNAHKRNRIHEKAQNVAENKEIIEQNMLIRIANEMALRLHGTSKTEFLGNNATQIKLLQQVQSDWEKLAKINDKLYRECNDEPEKLVKKQKLQELI